MQGFSGRKENLLHIPWLWDDLFMRKGCIPEHGNPVSQEHDWSKV